MNSTEHILVADDKDDIIRALTALLQSRGFHVQSAKTPTEILRLTQHKAFDLLLLDLNYSRDTTSGKEGIDLLTKIKAFQPHLPVVVMTAFANMDVAVNVMRAGANDFIEKPWDNERLISVVQNQLALSSALSEVDTLKRENRRLIEGEETTVIAESAAMKPVMNLVERVSATDTNVLITGEHGTGKGVIAKLIHNRSDRCEENFISVNIGAIPDNLFESELFGHVKGAFTDAKTNREGRFSLANNGTIFLDEIGNLSPAMQAKLLRVLETGEFEPVGSSTTLKTNARIISATNADLNLMTKEQTFREDLLFRLNTIEVKLPPLKKRAKDIIKLADFYLDKYKRKYNTESLSYSEGAYSALGNYHWPGNVREMDHSIQRAVLMASDNEIQETDLGLVKAKEASVQSNSVYDDMTLAEVEEILIKRAVDKYQGNMVEAAKHLGIARSSLYRRIEKLS